MPQLILADKSDLFRRSLSSMLAREGYEVTTAESGARALALAAESRPALMILDIDVTDPSGLETLVRLKGDPSLRRMPVVMVSKDTTPVAVSTAFKLGAEGFRVKPVDLNALLKTLSALHAPSPELNAEVTVAAGDARLVGKVRFIDQYGQIYLDKQPPEEGQPAPVAMGALGSLVTLSYEIGKDTTYVQHALLAEENDQGLALFPAGQAVSSGAPELFKLCVSLKARYLLPGAFVKLADIAQVTAESLMLKGVAGEPRFNSTIQVTLFPFGQGGGSGLTIAGKVGTFHTHPDGLTDIEVLLTEPGGAAYVDLLANLVANRPPRSELAPQEQEVAS
jgi:CheY-like chemotaxis protein